MEVEKRLLPFILRLRSGLSMRMGKRFAAKV
jgi:hypothetical protein